MASSSLPRLYTTQWWYVLKHEHSACMWLALLKWSVLQLFCAHFFSLSFDLTAHQITFEGNNKQFKFIDSPLKLCFIAQLDVHMVWFTRPIYVADTKPKIRVLFPSENGHIFAVWKFLPNEKCYWIKWINV